ncbi:MAG TPA: hypothetical protein VIX19_08405 [Terriglobales bacterium]
MATLETLTLPPQTRPDLVAGRVRFIMHRGKRVLSIDYAHCDVPLLKAVAEEGHRVIARELLNSVLTLNDVTATSFDQESVEVLKSKVGANAPYVKRAAVIGISGLQRLIYEAVKLFTKRTIPNFSSREEALDYLVGD